MILLLLFLICFQSVTLPVYASESVVHYARIMFDDVYLYKTTVDIDEYTNVLFSLPKTYFVQLLDNAGNDFFKVNYLNFTGFVKKECVQTIIGTPRTPYLENISFRVYSEQSRDLRNEPTTQGGSSQQVAYIPLYSRNLTYYGAIQGESLIEERTNIWYYVKYSADKDYYGYVYSDFCDKFSDMPLNTEEVVYTTYPDFGKTENYNPSAVPLESNTAGIIIGILTVPALIFVFMVLKGTKLMRKEKTSSKEIKDYQF